MFSIPSMHEKMDSQAPRNLLIVKKLVGTKPGFILISV